jgi:guanylate kinase
MVVKFLKKLFGSTSGEKGILLVITGPSGVGKDSVIAEFLKRNSDFNRIVTDTTRLPRASEINGVDYNFFTLEQFTERVRLGFYLEHVEVRPKEYKGTTKRAIVEIAAGKKIVWKIDEYAAANIRKIIKKEIPGKAREILARTVTVYLACEEWSQLREQYFNRESEANKQWFRVKLERDKKMWEKYHDRFDRIVVNRREKMFDTVKEIEKIVAAKT